MRFVVKIENAEFNWSYKAKDPDEACDWALWHATDDVSVEMAKEQGVSPDDEDKILEIRKSQECRDRASKTFKIEKVFEIPDDDNEPGRYQPDIYVDTGSQRITEYKEEVDKILSYFNNPKIDVRDDPINDSTMIFALYEGEMPLYAELEDLSVFLGVEVTSGQFLWEIARCMRDGTAGEAVLA